MSKTFLNWSSGKDASFCLHQLIKTGKKPDLLLSTINKKNQRIGLHGLHRSLLEKQAQSIGIPLKVIELEESTSHEAYNRLMFKVCSELKEKGFDTAYYGDIFLEDLRAYREKQLAEVGLKAEFPLWNRDTKELIQEFVSEGFKACIVSASAQYFDEAFVGREIDQNFLNSIPEKVDPCGENGEFHSFCYDGPIFQKAITFEKGEKLIRTYPSPGRKEDNQKISFHFIELF